MALPSTTRRWTNAVRIALGGGVLAATALAVLAVPAGAHTPKLLAGCENGVTTLKVELKAYNASKANSLKVTDGDDVVIDLADFDANYTKTWEFDGSVAHHFTVVVRAWDDPNNDKGFSFVEERDVAACVTPTEPTTTTTTVPPTTTVSETTTTEVTTTTSEETTSSESTTEPTTTTTVAATTTTAVSDDDLATTGSSIGVPLALGVLLLIGGGAIILVARKRGRI